MKSIDFVRVLFNRPTAAFREDVFDLVHERMNRSVNDTYHGGRPRPAQQQRAPRKAAASVVPEQDVEASLQRVTERLRTLGAEMRSRARAEQDGPEEARGASKAGAATHYIYNKVRH
jgi:hypothetical protein